MKEDNKKFIDISEFYERVKKIMSYKSMTIDDLYDAITNRVGYQITKSNLLIYLQRVPNVNFLVALSKALNVSADYLLGLSDSDLYNDGFDLKYNTQKYKKYFGTYYLYFCPTVNNSPSKVSTASLRIEPDIGCKVTLSIETTENETKEYLGTLVLSQSYDVGYIVLKCKNFGEMIYMSFCDPVINGTSVTTEFLVGAMISISSGDFKRVPVMSRFVLSKRDILQDNEDIIRANLLLNTKYVFLTKESLSKAILQTNMETALHEAIEQRLAAAFTPKETFAIEESYVLNTLKNDLCLTFHQAMDLLTQLRLLSLTSANNKLNKSLDARLYAYITSRL